MTVLEMMHADAKAAQKRQKKLWSTGSHSQCDGTGFSAARSQQPRRYERSELFETVTHRFAWSKVDLAYNPRTPGFSI